MIRIKRSRNRRKMRRGRSRRRRRRRRGETRRRQQREEVLEETSRKLLETRNEGSPRPQPPLPPPPLHPGGMPHCTTGFR